MTSSFVLPERSNMPLESKFEKELILELKRLYPGCIILKNDANYMQGLPDRLILYGTKWAAFEVKAHEHAKHQPNQDYYVRLLNDMSYATFVYPQNKEVFLDELQQALGPRRRTRFSRG
jgi:hypothetical protein